jgi:type II secretory pathway component PulM
MHIQSITLRISEMECNWSVDKSKRVMFCRSIMRPASLQKERLEEQLREHRLLQSDVDNHRPSVESVAQSAQELVATASNARLAKKIETKLRDVTTR